MARSVRALAVAIAFAVAGSAQVVVDPCGPGVLGTPSTSPELGSAGLGVAEVAQLALVPNPSGSGWLGSATVKRIGNVDFDVLAFSWSGPGTAPVADATLDALNGPGDEGSCSLSHDGRALVMDCGAGNPASAIGNHPILATRATSSGPFTVVGDLGGMFPAFPGYYDPRLGRADLDDDGTLDDVVFFTTPTGGIDAGKLDRVSGAVTSRTIAIPPLSHLPGFVSCHSPAPACDRNGVTRGLWFAVHSASSGSDAYWYPGIATALHPQATALGRRGHAVFDDGAAWDANPAVLRGTVYFARAAGAAFGDPLRIDAFTLSSAAVVASAGGPATHVGLLPSPRWTAPFAAAINLGYAQFATPITPASFGFLGVGHVCVVPMMAIGVSAANGEITLSYPVAAGLPRGVVLLQALALETNRNELWASNVAWLELR
ncbi:MAG: hypothetical protein HZB39_02825 [Planctomycetes bacterium]|nr:hypothetical protein [Planctomycetota bacterium]